jgi:hypothetical protein
VINLKHLSDPKLHLQTVARSETERMSTIDVLWHLRENERRLLYAKMGYRDLKEYCVKELKYTEGSAWRRISAMRLLKEIPEIEGKIQTGELNLTQMSMAQTHFREMKSSLPEKKQVLLELESQSIQSTERVLAEKKPEGWIETASRESTRAKRGGNVELTVTLDSELQKELEEIEILLGKEHSKLELIKFMAKHTLKAIKKKVHFKSNAQTDSHAKDQNKSLSQEAEKVPTDIQHKAQPLRSPIGVASKSFPTSRYIPIHTRRVIAMRDQYRCQYQDPRTGYKCGARLNLQIEHVQPFAKGGGHTLHNLQLLCANHNKLRAIQQFGVEKMQEFLPSIR